MIVLRRADLGDVVALVALVESAYRGESSRSGWTTEADLLDGQRIDTEMMEATLRDPDCIVLVGTEGERLVGCCEVRREPGGSAAFGMFAVEPSRQAAGLGRELLAAAEDVAADELGARSMTMSVIEQRRELIDWYRRRGYEAAGESREFPYGDERFGLPRRDDLRFIVMVKILSGAK